MSDKLTETAEDRFRRPYVDCLIIGAGMAGLAAAHRLQSQGLAVALLDKGRGVGGRLATRWRERDGGNRAYFDHGAQFFTVRTPLFQSFVDRWRQEGLVREWSRGFAGATTESHPDGHPRYVVEGGMNALARHLASPLPVFTGTQVTAIQGEGAAGWSVHLATGETWAAPALLLTPPVPPTPRLRIDRAASRGRATARRHCLRSLPCPAGRTRPAQPPPRSRRPAVARGTHLLDR